jgi:hypothetical protein
MFCARRGFLASLPDIEPRLVEAMGVLWLRALEASRMARMDGAMSACEANEHLRWCAADDCEVGSSHDALPRILSSSLLSPTARRQSNLFDSLLHSEACFAC